MPALLHLDIENFKSLRDVRVELAPVNVLVGPNASGKSNFLDVIQFLGDSVREDLGPALDSRGGFERVRYRGVDGEGPVRIHVGANVTRYSSPTAPDEYDLSFSTRRGSVRRTDDDGSTVIERRDLLSRWESFQFKRRKGPGRRITINGSNVEILAVPVRGGTQRIEKRRLLRRDSLGLSTLPRLASEEGGDEVTRIAEMFSSFRVFDVNVTAARRPSVTRSGDQLRPTGSNLSAFLFRLAEDEERFEGLVDDARRFVPGLADIHFVKALDREDSVVVELEERSLSGRTRLSEASYGTVRALALLAMLYDPAPPLLTCVEEIDHGLHPYVFERLVELVREASSRTQFLIATHSPALVNRLRPEELIVCERDERTGESRIPAIDPEAVMAMASAAEGELGLGEIWFTGSLGGVPS